MWRWKGCHKKRTRSLFGNASVLASVKKPCASNLLSAGFPFLARGSVRIHLGVTSAVFFYYCFIIIDYNELFFNLIYVLCCVCFFTILFFPGYWCPQFFFVILTAFLKVLQLSCIFPQLFFIFGVFLHEPKNEGAIIPGYFTNCSQGKGGKNTIFFRICFLHIPPFFVKILTNCPNFAFFLWFWLRIICI